MGRTCATSVPNFTGNNRHFAVNVALASKLKPIKPFAFLCRENPAQLHRLIPWLNRELVSLCPTTPHSIPYLLQNIENLLQTYDMTSREFRRRVRTFVPNYTEHFVHELINFARTPYDIIGYDRNVAYNPVFEDDRVIMLSSSSSDESDIEFVLDMRLTNMDASTTATNGGGPSTAIESAASTSASATTSAASSSNPFSNLVRRNRMLLGNDGHVVTPPSVRAMIDDDTDSGEEEITNYLHTKPTVSNEELIRGRGETAASPAPIPDQNNQSSSRTSEQTVIVSRSNNSSSGSVAVPSPAAVAVVVTHSNAVATETSANATSVVDHSDSDSDDCQFVCAKKPPHLRTPEFVELNSESDSDVVFVDETKLTGQAIKTEKNAKSKVPSIIVSSAGPSSVPSTNIIVSSGRRKRRHPDGDDINATPTSPTEDTPENLTTAMAMCAAIRDLRDATTLAADMTVANMEIKPSTSAQWKVPLDGQTSSVDLYQSANRPNAIVFNQNIHARAIPFMARKSAGGGKRIFEESSSSDDENSSEAELSSSSSSQNSSSGTDIKSSSHEEFVVSASTRKQKSTNDEPQRAMRKRFRKRVNTKQVAARKKKNSKSSIKPKRACKNRNQRTKMTPDTTSSSDEEHSD